MTVREFLGDRQGKLLLHFISAAALSSFLMLTGTAEGIVIILLIVWMIGLTVSLGISYTKENSYLKSLSVIMNELDQRYLFAECVPKPKQVYEKKLFEFMRRSGKSMIEAVSEAQAQQKEYQEYIENWVHEIKVPITTVQLICSNNKSEIAGKIIPQLGQIEEHVERALYYGRLNCIEKDFIIRENNLDEIAAQAIRKQQPLLIHNGVRIETDGLDRIVYTDSKWVSFMLGQLLSNAVRYKSENPVIQIKAKNIGNLVQLNVADNGIGIPDHELARIFERGFTGSNGRNRGGSTGMGLYICKKLADFLQIDISAKSSENEYTIISMVFPAKEHLAKM